MPAHGVMPQTGEAKLRVKFRCGYVDDKHAYTAKQLRWTDTGSGWDVVAYQRVGQGGPKHG